MFENTIGSITDLKNESAFKGGGLILAHCMGLGKTLSVVAYTSTLLSSPVIQSIRYTEKKNNECPIRTILIVAPKNTLNNWKQEYLHWMPPEVSTKAWQNRDRGIQVVVVESRKDDGLVRRWHARGGVLIMGFQMFRSLVKQRAPSPSTLSTFKTSSSAMVKGNSLKAQRRENGQKRLDVTTLKKYLLDPGPDICVIDEAHMIKSRDAEITRQLQDLRTKMRIALTG